MLPETHNDSTRRREGAQARGQLGGNPVGAARVGVAVLGEDQIARKINRRERP